MKFYKDENTNLYAYAADGSQDEYIKEGLTQITEIERDEILEAKRLAAEQSGEKVVPSVISRFQAMSVLEEIEIEYNGGTTTIANATQSYIDSLNSDTAENRAMKRAWNYATEFQRNSETIKAMAFLLNLSDDQVDELFIEASKIKG